jgi:hypothetical protein
MLYFEYLVDRAAFKDLCHQGSIFLRDFLSRFDFGYQLNRSTPSERQLSRKPTLKTKSSEATFDPKETLNHYLK